MYIVYPLPKPGMFAVLCLLGVRSRPARNLLLSLQSAYSRAPLLGSSGGPGRGRAEAGPGDSRRLSLVPGSRAPAGPAAAVQPRHTGAAPPSH